MRKRIRSLVTGGAGFIGSHLVDRLIREGLDVIVLDDFSSGRITNLAQHDEESRLKIIRTDISKLELIQPYFAEVDWVFHIAGLADIVPSVQQPLRYHEANVSGTISVLEAARSNKVARFIYAASSSCYGIPDLIPTPEEAPIRPEHPYALTKYLGEQYVLHWNQLYKLPCISLRLFNVFGPRSRTTGAYGAVFGVFLAQKLAGKPFTVVGDGTQTRDFTFVTDVADAFIRAADSEIQGEIFNVGSGGTYSVNELVRYLENNVEYIPKRPGEPDCTFADTRKIARGLGWKPKIGFKEGVRIILENINQWQGAPVWDRDSISEATRDWFTYFDTS